MDLREALGELWRSRARTDRSPWALGWFAYDACAELAGAAKRRSNEAGTPRGLWLIDPKPGSEDILENGRRGTGWAFRESLSDAEFAEGVRVIRRLIAEGSVYQVNLCRRFSGAPWRGGLSPLLEAVRSGPLPAYLSAFSWAGEPSGELLCASMEMLFSRRADTVRSMPIKGTRPRGRTEDADRRLAAELAADPKEVAELSMIVDLVRNDLGRLARPGSVRVADTGSVHSFALVHHRIAEIVCTLDPHASPWQILEVLSPGGSVTGCPKIAAMEAIDRLEPVSRGPFTGALGVVAANGDAEVALPIRTAWCSEERLDMAAGCGVVWPSRAEQEVRESRLKISHWLDLLVEKPL